MNNYLSSLKQGLINHQITLDKATAQSSHKLLCNHIDSLIFNVVSIASIITMINSSKTIKKPTIKIVNSYINEKCISKKMTGGTVLPSEYFGINSGAYNSANPTGDILNIDFASGLIRPQIGGGGKNTANNYIMSKINEIINYYKLDASKVIKADLCKIINNHISCLMNFLKSNNKSPLKKDDIKKIIKSNKSLDIFK